MLNPFDGVTFLTGTPLLLQNMRLQPARPPFDEAVIAFLDSFSRALLQDPATRAWPDVATLAFWCRKRALLREKQRYADLEGRLGRGLAFHLAPANVATNFAWSMVAGLLSGNNNIVRLPSRDFPQLTHLCKVLNQLLLSHPDMAPGLCLVRYDHNKALTDLFSSWCQTRLIWGGDETIATIRHSPLPPRSIDLTFANRYSLALIDAEYYLQTADKKALAAAFYNDTYLMDQNACSSPRLVIWTGNKQAVGQARLRFWSELETYVAARYSLSPIMALNKFSRFCQHSASTDGIKKASSASNLVFRILLDELDDSTLQWRAAGGYFLEYIANELSDILPVCGSGCQTLAVLGVDAAKLHAFIARYRPAGIDRIVPFGQTLAFDLRWDGYDMIYHLSRVITINNK